MTTSSQCDSEKELHHLSQTVRRAHLIKVIIKLNPSLSRYLLGYVEVTMVQAERILQAFDNGWWSASNTIYKKVSATEERSQNLEYLT